MINMESSERTTAVLRMYERLSQDHPSVGITLQAYLERSGDDLARILESRGRVRLVKGAYAESPEISLPRGPRLDARYLDFVERVVAAGRPCSIATHDPRVIERAVRIVDALGRRASVEFEMLLGVQEDLLDQLRADGFRTRVFVPFGNEWYLYVCHRLSEHPPSILRAVADVIGPVASTGPSTAEDPQVSRPIVVGIQGGRGSFNEEAARRHAENSLSRPIELRYLFTTEAVLRHLDSGRIDFGQFALYNTRGGVYDETIEAVGRHLFHVVSCYSLEIQHALLAHPSARREDITRLITHPAVLKQCERNLAQRARGLSIEAGRGDFLDPARVAEAIASGELPPSVATVTNARVALEHGLAVLESGLEDERSASWFLLVVGRTAVPELKSELGAKP